MLGFAPALRLGSGLKLRGSAELSDQVLAVLREALSNAARHSGATRVDVTVDTDDAGMLTVLVRDNGRGIGDTGRRSGLANMASRRSSSAACCGWRPRKAAGPNWSGECRSRRCLACLTKSHGLPLRKYPLR